MLNIDGLRLVPKCQTKLACIHPALHWLNQCLLCAQPSSHFVCPYCIAHSGVLARRFLRHNLLDEHRYPTLHTVNFDCILVLDWYVYPWQRLIPLIKFHQAQHLTQTLAKWFYTLRLRHYYRAHSWPQALIPVPLHAKRLKQRGYNQTALLTKHLGTITQLPVVDHAAMRTKYTQAQSELTREARLANIEGAFSIDPHVLKEYQHIAIVEDVLTTGATLNALCKALYQVYPQLHITVWCMHIAVDQDVMDAFAAPSYACV
ncbi:MAG: hypothetical protein ABWW63_02410 [Glaciecola sp.]